MPGGSHSPIEGLIQRSFGGGELAPALAARADQVKYVSGLRTCRNFLVQRAGGVANRPGLRFIDECKFASPTVQLMCYVSEVEGESILIECGAGYLRFYRNGAQVTVAGVPAYNGATAYVIGDLVSNAGVNYYCRANSTGNAPPNAAFWYALDTNVLEVPTGFAGDLPKWNQSGRTITLTHHLHPPQELIYVSLTRWIIRNANFAPIVAAPAMVGVTAGAVGARTFKYVVTAAGADYEESYASGQGIVAAALEPTADAPNVITWAAVAGALEYYVYCDNYENGIFGFIGTAPAAATTFRDTGFVPDFTVTPPINEAHFAVAGEYPSCVTHFQQRRVFGNTDHAPDAIFASRVGFPSNHGISSPLQDDDALIFRLAATTHQPVKHLVGLKQLIVLTATGEWNVHGDQSGVLAPNTIGGDQQGYVGAADVRPVVVGNSVIYLQARGRIMRDLQFDVNVEGLAGRDLTVFSSHLFDKNTIRSMDYQQTPHSIVWAVRDDGVLLGCTYLREQDVWGWHRHTTGALNAAGANVDGWFWSVCVVPELDQDALYCIVRRTIGAATVRYIERLEPREIVTFDEDCFFVDSGLSYSGAPVNNVVGLNHLNGEVVAVVGDGAVISDGQGAAPIFTVVAGTLSPALPASYSNIHVGLAIRRMEIETLDTDAQGAAVRDKMKRQGPLDVLVDESSRTFKAGPDASNLSTYTAPSFDPTGDSFSGQVEINIPSTFNKYGRVLIRQTDPLPLTILGVIPHMELGG